jgi:hypothetical protein
MLAVFALIEHASRAEERASEASKQSQKEEFELLLISQGSRLPTMIQSTWDHQH